MQTAIQEDSLLKNIVIQYPLESVTSILEGHGLDFCCGGNRTLKDSCAAKNVDVQIVITELNCAIEEAAAKQSNAKADKQDEASSAKQDFSSLNNMTAKDLAQHIIDTHHKYLRDNVPIVQELMSKVHRVHGPKHSELHEIHKLVMAMTSELLEHIAEEENESHGVLAMALKTGKKEGTLATGIEALEKDHEKHGKVMQEITTLTNNFTPPADACMSYKKLFTKIKELIEDVHKHVHKENYVLFPKLM